MDMLIWQNRYMILSFVFESQILISNAFNIDNTIQSSYALFEGWDGFVMANGSLEFSFKTNVSDGILLDSRNEVERLLKVDLYKGMLRTCYKECENRKSKQWDMVLLGSHWNDMRWHTVKIYRLSREIRIYVEGYRDVIVIGKVGAVNTTLTSSTLYLGGGGPQYGITGCVKDISYPIGFKRSPRSFFGNVQTECLDECSEKEKKGCLNNGKCIKLFTPHTLCDCAGTGYSGMHCTHAEPTAHLDEFTFISDIVYRNLRQSRINTITLRFRTYNACGVILYGIIDSWNYLLIELVNGNVEVNFSLGSGKIIIVAGNSQLNNGKWHSIIIMRFGKVVTLDIDHGRHFSGKSFKYEPTTIISCKQGQKFYFGGHTYKEVIQASKTKTKFKGCLQQIYINNDIDNYKITNEHLQKAKHYEKQVSQDEYITGYTRVYGKLLSCDVDFNLPNEDAQDCGNVIQDGPNEIKVRGTQKLSQKTVSWITAGICSGSLAIIVTLVCGFHFLRRNRDEYPADTSRSGSVQYGAMREATNSNQYNGNSRRPFGVVL